MGSDGMPEVEAHRSLIGDSVVSQPILALNDDATSITASIYQEKVSEVVLKVVGWLPRYAGPRISEATLGSIHHQCPANVRFLVADLQIPTILCLFTIGAVVPNTKDSRLLAPASTPWHAGSHA